MNDFDKILPILIPVAIQILLGAIITVFKGLIISKEKFKEKFGKIRETILEKLTETQFNKYEYIYNFLAPQSNIGILETIIFSEFKSKYLDDFYKITKHILNYEKKYFLIKRYLDVIKYCHTAIILSIFIGVLFFIFLLISSFSGYLYIFSILILVVQIIFISLIHIYDSKFDKIDNEIFEDAK